MPLWILNPNWSDETGRALHAALLDAVSDKDELQDLWISTGFHKTDVDWDGAVRHVWLAVLEEAHERGGARQMIELVADRKPAIGDRLRALLATNVQGGTWYRAADRYGPRLLGHGGRRALIDRRGLSDAVRRVAEDEYLVLSIRGDPGSGRSHSWFLVSHVAASQGRRGCRVITLDVASEWPDDERATDVDAGEFVCALARKVDMDPHFAVDLNTEATRISRDLASMFVARYQRLGRTGDWIFIDGLDRAGVRDDVHALVGHLAIAAWRNELADVRLILTGHRGGFAADVTRDVLVEDAIEPIRREHVEGFFDEIAAHIGLELTEGEAAQLADAVLADAALDDLRELERGAVRRARERFGA